MKETDFKYDFKQPSECSEERLKEFCGLVIKGGKVQEEGLLDRIKNSYLLGFCVFGDRIVGVSSLKKPTLGYAKSIIQHHSIDRQPEELTHEIGYSFTLEQFRNQGISSNLKIGLLSSNKITKSLVFSTTAILNSQNFFKKNGFKQVGKPYDGTNDRGILYFEKKIE